MAAAFDDELVEGIDSTIGTEAGAFGNDGWGRVSYLDVRCQHIQGYALGTWVRSAWQGRRACQALRCVSMVIGSTEPRQLGHTARHRGWVL